jgi:hypothetical protein
MIVVEKPFYLFKFKELHFCNEPFDIAQCSAAKFVLCNKMINRGGFEVYPGLSSIIDLTREQDEIWSKFDKSCRYKINRAPREGITIKFNEGWNEFYPIYKSLSQKKGFGSWGLWDVNLEVMKKYGTLFIAEIQGNIVSGHLYLEDAENIEFWIGASKRLEAVPELATQIGFANRLLHWEAMKYARNKGLKTFDLGGIWDFEEAKNDPVKQGINNFKLSFGGQVESRYTYVKFYSNLYKAGQNIFQHLRKRP